ncbi:MAG: maltotransferase domain-containing protein [Terriglobales bacterium]
MIRRSGTTPQTRGAAAPFGPTSIVMECIRPSVDGGAFAVKRTVGDSMEASADIYQHGHELLAAVLRVRAPGTKAWREIPMVALDNDRWRGEWVLDEVGTWEFGFAAWVDIFASWRQDTQRKQAAGQDIASDLVAGAALAQEAAARIPSGALHAADAALLRAAAAGDAKAGDAQALLAAAVLDAARRWPDPAARQTTERTWQVLCERPRARCGAWYEMFARSQGSDPDRSATFAECEARLPEIAAMGFDVIYLPPIHPVGQTHRKGRNNALLARPEDPGSPYAIGNARGGHDAVDPGLGTLAGFDRFVAACARHGMEVALDFALNCSPDHPWVGEHPEWFYHRPDGSIRYAENPPKRYEDVFPLNFDGPSAPALAAELRRVLLFWAEHGVRIFRVDNPHTKPFSFWAWLLAQVREHYPDVVFLAEAFTRPKPMKRLAKLGFSQSYTYFTWRNSKQELSEYVTELALGPGREYFRPNFFVNTPDILPEILQHGGRPAFLQRMILAATLSPSWGMYNGFELCEARALLGTEEYADSEKYQYKVWDWDRPGNIKDWIAKVNRIRREHPALQHIEGLRFLRAENPQMLVYARFSPGYEDVLVVAVNLDPFGTQEGAVEIPGPELGLGDGFTVNDLLAGPRGLWRGRHHYLQLGLDPPAVIFHLTRAGG